MRTRDAPAPAPARVPRVRAPECFADPGFCAALREMRALGLRVTPEPHAGAVPFDVRAGRMRLRWYLMPPGPRDVRRASLALIQPLRTRARLGKRLLGAAAWLGAPHLGRHAVAWVSGSNRLAALFGRDPMYTAFVTGTTGPHRKLAVQFMDARGCIRGYAKVACAPAARALLANEAAALAALHREHLRSALVPRLLLHTERDGAAMLATDAVRTTRDASRTRLGAAHLAFLDELAARSATWRVPDGAALLHALRAQTEGVATSLSDRWRSRLGHAWRELALAPELIAPRGIAHGDFTPANTFEHRNHLCVFDWEYAGPDYPADYDLIRFAFAVALLRYGRARDCCRAVEAMLAHELRRTPPAARARLLAYLYVQVLLLAGRQCVAHGQVLTWEGECAASLMLDALGARDPDAP